MLGEERTILFFIFTARMAYEIRYNLNIYEKLKRE